jgi:hypothetical protein
MKIWKLLGALALNVCLLVGAAYALAAFGWIATLQPRAWLVLIVTALGILFKLLFGDLATGEFQYHKHGYDLCVLTMGAALSGLSLQLLSERNIFPGMQATGPIVFAKYITPDPVQQSRILLFVVFLASSLAALLTARIAKAIRESATRGKHLLACVNFCTGAAMLGWYVLILITKE